MLLHTWIIFKWIWDFVDRLRERRLGELFLQIMDLKDHEPYQNNERQNRQEIVEARLMRKYLDLLYSRDKCFVTIFSMISKGQITEKGFLYYCFNSGRKILKYAFVSGLRYECRLDMGPSLERVVDFPILRRLIFCPCTSRPLYAAMIMLRPDVVRLLLNCGATMPPADAYDFLGIIKHPLERVLNLMMEEFEQENSGLGEMFHGGLTCEELANRVEFCLRLAMADLKPGGKLWNMVFNAWEGMAERGFLEHVENIPTLKHMCRTSVRCALRDSVRLCDENVGDLLGLPAELVSYVYLDELKENCD